MITKTIAVYELDTGRILRLTTCTDEDQHLQVYNANEAYIDVAYDLDLLDTSYVVDGVLTTRPSLDSICSFTNSSDVWVANGTDSISYGDALPVTTTYKLYAVAGADGIDPFIAPQEGTITTGTFSMTTTRKGIYTLIFDAFPYRKKTITVEAT